MNKCDDKERAVLMGFASRVDPNDAGALNNLGVVYFKLDRLDMAKGYFWASLDLDPTNTEAKGLMETMAKLQRRAARTAAVEN